MATQTVLLSQPVDNRSAVVCTLARQKAVKAIKERLRAQGVRLRDVSNRELHIWADLWFEAHRQELIDQTTQWVMSCPELRKLYDREQRLRAKLITKSRTTEQPKINHFGCA
jgi:hypothetical protein